MGRRRSKNGMIDIGEFQRLNSGRCMFKCKTCKQQMEIKDLNLFINHVKENHPIKNSNSESNVKADKVEFDKQNLRLLDENKLSKINKRTEVYDLEIAPENEIKPIPKLKINIKRCEVIKVTNQNFETINELQADTKLLESSKNITKVKINQNNIDLFSKINNIDTQTRYQDHNVNSDSDDYIDSGDFKKLEINFSILPKENSDISKSTIENSYNQNSESNCIVDSNNFNDINCNSNVNEPKETFLSKSRYFTSESDDFKTKIVDSDHDYDNFEKDICFTCEKCGIKYKKQSTLIKHLKICQRSKKKHKIKKKQKLIKAKEKNENGMYECSNCELEMSTVNELKLHEKLHILENIKQKIQCEICGKSLNSITGLNIHLMRHTGLSPYKCLICDRGFYNKYTLAAHQQTHNSEKEYKCEHCDKEYGRYVDLKRHVRYTHLKEKPNPVMCDLCGKSFSFAFNLKYHMRRHLNVKPIKCDKCDMTFVEKGDLNKHLITHNPDHKPFICEICSKSFSRKITLTKHQKLHTGLKEYICKICGKAFAQSPGLYMHMKTHGFNIKPEGAGYYERQSHLLFRNMNSDRANLI